MGGIFAFCAKPRGLRRRINELDCVLVLDALIAGISDESLLDLSAIEGRVMVTHDAKTMIGHAIGSTPSIFRKGSIAFCGSPFLR